MHQSRTSRIRKLVGLALAMLALCALNVQALAHYQPQMLLDGSICSAGSGSTDRSDSQDEPSRIQITCALCCAHAQAAVAAGGGQQAPVWSASSALHAAPTPAVAHTRRAWASSRPRGPPTLA